MKERTRCQKHGGKAATGAHNGRFVFGQRMQSMTHTLAKLTRIAASDPELLEIRQDLVTVEAVLRDRLSRLKDGRAISARDEARILNLIDTRRKLIETESRRKRDLGLMVPGDRFVGAMTAAADAFATTIRAMCEAGVAAGSDPAPWKEHVRRRFQLLRMPAITDDEESTIDKKLH